MVSSMIDRCYRAAISVAVFSSFVLTLLALSLQYSPLAPISSIKDCWSMISLGFLFWLLMQMGVIFLECFLLSTWIFSVNFEPNLNICKFECLLAAMIIFTANILLSFFLTFVLRKQLAWFLSSSLFLLWLMSSITLAFYSAFTTNFQLRFVENAFTLSSVKKNIGSWVVGSLAVHAVSTIKIFCVAWVSALNFAVLLRPFHSSLSSLFTFWHFADFLLPIFVQGLILRFTPFVVTFFVMKPIEFAMPTLFYAATEGLSSPTMTLTNALDSKDRFTKLSALYQLQRMCSTSKLTRKPFYALSQPGGHPRNWNSLRDAAVAQVRNVRNLFQVATHCKSLVPSSAVGAASVSNSVAEISVCEGSPGVLNELYEAKHSFFVPPTLIPRSADAFLSERSQSRRLVVVPSFCDSIIGKLKEYFFASPPIVSSFDTQCALYAIKALTKVISHSLQEDEFGVVQKDMSKSLSELTRLSIAIDAFVRASGRSSNSFIEKNTVLLDEELAAGLKEIREAFGSHIKDLNLHPTELEVFRMLA